jgi:hypothetical protein
MRRLGNPVGQTKKLIVIARSEATKQSSFDICAGREMDCFASLAMTGA